jgi:hypothetical protein
MNKLTLSALIVASAAFAAGLSPAQAHEGRHHGEAFERMCSDTSDSARPHHELGERLSEHLDLNDAQKAAYKEFKEARLKSLEDAKAKLCASKPDLSSFESRLVFRQTLMEARLEALKAENPKLIAFYNSLDDKQKSRFDRFRARKGD